MHICLITKSPVCSFYNILPAAIPFAPFQASCEAACEKVERQNAKLRHSLKQNSSLERGESVENNGMVRASPWFGGTQKRSEYLPRVESDVFE